MDLNTNQGEIRYLTPLDINTNSKKKYCRFKRLGIKYIDYKDCEEQLKEKDELQKNAEDVFYALEPFHLEE